MMRDDPALTFALTLKRWFRANGWPQKITDDWAKDAGIQSATGPWASQVCNAMKAAGYNPKAEFFLALGEFNRFVAEQDVMRVKDTKLRDRLAKTTPLLHENGQPYGAADFWSLYAGLLEPPSAFADSSVALTQDDVDEWVKGMRTKFRQISLEQMCSRAEAWQMLSDALVELNADEKGWVREVLAGLHDPTVDDAQAYINPDDKKQPLAAAMDHLLGSRC